MQAFNGNSSVKVHYLEQVRGIQEAFKQRKSSCVTWRYRTKCALYLAIASQANSGREAETLELELGIPERLGVVCNAIFGALPDDKSLTWSEDFLRAIPVGADLSLVWHQFAAWIFGESGLIFATERNSASVAMVADLHRRAASGSPPSHAEWLKAAQLSRHCDPPFSEDWQRGATEAATRSAWSEAGRARKTRAESKAGSVVHFAAESATLFSAWKAAQLSYIEQTRLALKWSTCKSEARAVWMDSCDTFAETTAVAALGYSVAERTRLPDSMKNKLLLAAANAAAWETWESSYAAMANALLDYIRRAPVPFGPVEESAEGTPGGSLDCVGSSLLVSEQFLTPAHSAQTITTSVAKESRKDRHKKDGIKPIWVTYGIAYLVSIVGAVAGGFLDRGNGGVWGMFLGAYLPSYLYLWDVIDKEGVKNAPWEAIIQTVFPGLAGVVMSRLINGV